MKQNDYMLFSDGFIADMRPSQSFVRSLRRLSVLCALAHSYHFSSHFARDRFYIGSRHLTHIHTYTYIQRECSILVRCSVRSEQYLLFGSLTAHSCANIARFPGSQSVIQSVGSIVTTNPLLIPLCAIEFHSTSLQTTPPNDTRTHTHTNTYLRTQREFE